MMMHFHRSIGTIQHFSSRRSLTRTAMAKVTVIINSLRCFANALVEVAMARALAVPVVAQEAVID